MEYKFDINAKDNGLVIKFKKEANNMLASANPDNKYELFTNLTNAIDIVKNLGNILYYGCEEEVNCILNIVNKFWKVGLLSPLTLNDDEFSLKDEDNTKTNIRYSSIYKHDDNVYNNNAYSCTVRAAYNHSELNQVNIKQFTINKHIPIYISKGGVITGDYIYDCIIPKDVVDKHCFTIQSIVNIPVSKITNKTDEDSIYVVDHREPKLKALMSFYDVPVHHDDYIHDMKFNIRKYKKL